LPALTSPDGMGDSNEFRPLACGMNDQASNHHRKLRLFQSEELDYLEIDMKNRMVDT